MRIVLVTSEVNYVRDNYRHLLRHLVDRFPGEIRALVVIKNADLTLFFKSLILTLGGCPRLGFILLKNILNAWLSSPFSFFKTRGLSLHFSNNINSEESKDFLSSLRPDLILNLRTRNIYKQAVLDIPRIGCINVHHGLLPKYRGTMCDLWALSEGRPVGFSVHWMNAKLDDGDILATFSHKALNTRDYSKIPYLSSLEELEVLTRVIRQLRGAEKLTTEPNKCDSKVYSRNPDWKQIRKLRREGIRL